MNRNLLYMVESIERRWRTNREIYVYDKKLGLVPQFIEDLDMRKSEHRLLDKISRSGVSMGRPAKRSR